MESRLEKLRFHVSGAAGRALLARAEAPGVLLPARTGHPPGSCCRAGIRRCDGPTLNPPRRFSRSTRHGPGPWRVRPALPGGRSARSPASSAARSLGSTARKYRPRIETPTPNWTKCRRRCVASATISATSSVATWMDQPGRGTPRNQPSTGRKLNESKPRRPYGHQLLHGDGLTRLMCLCQTCKNWSRTSRTACGSCGIGSLGFSNDSLTHCGECELDGFVATDQSPAIWNGRRRRSAN